MQESMTIRLDMSMILTKKNRINPDSKTISSLWETSRACMAVWNDGIEQRQNEPSLNVYEQKRRLTQFKKANPGLKKPSSQVLQNVIFAIDRSCKMYETKRKQGDKKVKPPRLKKAMLFFTQEYSQKNISFKFESDSSGSMLLKLAYGSRPSDWLSISIEPQDYSTAKTVTIVYQNKKWYACVTYNVQLPEKKKDGHQLYFDPGCKVALTGIKTSGEFCEYDLKPLYEINRETYLLIDKLKALIATKKPDSYHYRRLKQQIRKLYSKISTRSKGYLHGLSNKILDDHPDVNEFAIGDWSKKDTLAKTNNRFVNKRINRAVQNYHPLEKLIGCLTYKALLRGQEVKRFDERGTTRTCVVCGYVHENGIDPSKRVFTCQQCSFTISRDHHSCLNFVKKFNAALWQRLSGNIPDRSIRTGLHPFSFKPRSSAYTIAVSSNTRMPSILIEGGCHI